MFSVAVEIWSSPTVVAVGAMYRGLSPAAARAAPLPWRLILARWMSGVVKMSSSRAFCMFFCADTFVLTHSGKHNQNITLRIHTHTGMHACGVLRAR